MSRLRHTFSVALGTAAVALVLSGIMATGAHAQDAPTKSTNDGVYTKAQAARGKEVFAGQCQSCHTPAEHSNRAFVNKWTGWPIAELYKYIADSMPESDPGTLTPGQYADIVAYVLELNNAPAGEVELPKNLEALTAIRFDTVKAGGMPPIRPRR
jgi:quinoprotein glucose dehydrogenase